MTPRRIAFVSDAIYPYNKGGKETRLFEITTRLAAKGHDVHIYCMKWWPGKSDRVENGVHLHGICPYIPLYSGKIRSIKQGVLFGLSCFKLLFTSFDVIDVDHMPFFPLYSIRIVCWLKGKKMIATWNEVWGEQYWTQYLRGPKGKLAFLIEKYSVQLPNTIVSISSMTTEKLLNTFQLNSKKIVTIPCGYNAENIAISPRSELTSDVIYVGRLLSHKNIDVLIQSIADVKKTNSNIICRIIGTGPEEKKLKNLQKKLNLEKNIIFHGELAEHTEVFSLMKASKVFVLPSTREGFGIVVLEANACGLPVITVNHPDNASTAIAQVVTGLDAKELAKNISTLLNDKTHENILKRMKKNIETYNWDSIIKKHEDAYSL